MNSDKDKIVDDQTASHPGMPEIESASPEACPVPLGLSEGEGTTHANIRMLLMALGVFIADQFTKSLVIRMLGYAQEYVLLDGFFKFVHWGNTGAAWSLFRGSNELLAVISLVALLGLFLARHHFEADKKLGQIALGCLFGGILGNLYDRLHPDRQHVIDFLYFHVYRTNGEEIGFPAFNLADSAICTGVGLLFLLSWQADTRSAKANASTSTLT